jgi:hypothetical protein
MVARKETPDILSDVLGNKLLHASVTKEPKPSTPEYHNYGKKDRLNTSKPVSQQGNTRPLKATVDGEGDKVKVTFYISSEAVESLENAWLSLRKLAKQRTRRSTSKSKIVEAAIRMAAQDVADKGEQSQFVDALVKL